MLGVTGPQRARDGEPGVGPEDRGCVSWQRQNLWQPAHLLRTQGAGRGLQQEPNRSLDASARTSAKQVKRYKSTTKRSKAHRAAPNLLERDFSAERPDHKWLTDITYIPTGEGWLYLAAILDLYTRRIVGWAVAKRMTVALTIGALKMAIHQRRPSDGLIHHSDQGSQYTDSTYQTLLKDHGIQVSMNGAGTWYDNAPMESFFGTLKSELVHHRVYRTRDEARPDLFYYI